MISYNRIQPLRLMFFQPDIPQNLGTIIRLCACLGIPLDVVEPCGFPFSAKALRRSSMDYFQLAKIKKHVNFKECCETLNENRLVLLTTNVQKTLWDFEFKRNDVLIVGSETSGVPDYVASYVDSKINIPMPGGGRSLNVAVSASIALGEAIRQLSVANQQVL